jgi:hypothetical protein
MANFIFAISQKFHANAPKKKGIVMFCFYLDLTMILDLFFYIKVMIS